MRITTRRLLLAALIAIVAIFGTIAASSAQDTTTTTTTTTTVTTAPAPKPKPCDNYKQYRHLLRKTLRYSAHNGDFRALPIGPKRVHKLVQMRACHKHRNEMKKYHLRLRMWKHRHRTWRFYHHIDVITPYGAWATPVSIVGCEGGTHGWNQWNTGGSGAAGPYQLLGHGAPMPANTVQRRARHHEIAHSLVLSSGFHPWDASRSCWG